MLLAAHWAWPQSRARLLLIFAIGVHFSAKVFQNELFAAHWNVRVGLPRAVLAGSIFLPMVGGNVGEMLEIWLLLLGGARGLLASAVLVALQSRAEQVFLSSSFSPNVSGIRLFPQIIGFFARFVACESGRLASFAALDVESGFLLGDDSTQIVSGILIFANAVAPTLLAPRRSGAVARQMFFQKSVLFLAAAGAAGWARRHLMLVRVFAPHFVFAFAEMIAAAAAAAFAELYC